MGDKRAVQCLIEKGQGMSSEINGRLYLLLSYDDIAKANGKASLALLVKGAVVAQGSLAISQIDESPGSELRQMIHMRRRPNNSKDVVRLDVEASLHILAPFSNEAIQQLAAKVLEECETHVDRRLSSTTNKEKNTKLLL